MRNLIIGLSFIFFALSGIVLFKALNIPVNHTQQQKSQDGLNTKSPSGESEDATGKPLQVQPSEAYAVKGVQAATAVSGEEGPNRNSELHTSDKTAGTMNKVRVLAVIGGGAFNAGQIVLDDALMSTIKDMVPDILSSPGYQVYVEGHTDDMPIKASSDKRYVDNMELSFLRAKAVASILVENGVSNDRISVTGYGETRPIASNESDEGRFKNRRVEIKLVPEDKEL